ncbi:MAG: hypothetical protein LGR52_01135 [Candidatus Thiosymbion ectosymbiont of Robbea hypermnestra]|nr:hypothetical protein [Candidatus Thiosymbion ectosymbiont of Robbea hypermnestra]
MKTTYKETIVEQLHEQFLDIVDQIDDREITLRLTAEEIFRKSLLLSAASYFETRIMESLMDIVSSSTDGNLLIEEFVRNKALSRQYHTLFQWGAGNANAFFGLFGVGFQSYMKKKVGEQEGMSESIRAFLEIGHERNQLVHQNYGTFVLEKNAKEIYESYLKARLFVEALKDLMLGYLEAEDSGEESRRDD